MKKRLPPTTGKRAEGLGHLEKSDPHKIFLFARQFDVAQNVLLQQVGNVSNNQVVVPMLVNLAFAFELYLKCLIVLDTGREVRTHNYRKLFVALTPTTRDKVKEIFDHLPKSVLEVAASHDEEMRKANFDYSFEGVLASSQDAFEKLRYNYEGKLRVGEGFTAGRAMGAVIEEIRNRQPEWFNPPRPSGTG